MAARFLTLCGLPPTSGGGTTGAAACPGAYIIGGGIRIIIAFTKKAGWAGGKTRVKFYRYR